MLKPERKSFWGGPWTKRTFPRAMLRPRNYKKEFLAGTVNRPSAYALPHQQPLHCIAPPFLPGKNYHDSILCHFGGSTVFQMVRALSEMGILRPSKFNMLFLPLKCTIVLMLMLMLFSCRAVSNYHQLVATPGTELVTSLAY